MIKYSKRSFLMKQIFVNQGIFLFSINPEIICKWKVKIEIICKYTHTHTHTHTHNTHTHTHTHTQIYITIPCSATYFLEVGARVSLKVATKGSFRGKKLWKFRFLGCFSKEKTEECDQKVWNVFDQFGITAPCSASSFLEVGARVSLKVATKGSLRGKKTLKN